MADEKNYNVEGPAAQRYAQLEHFRDPFLLRARQCSELTIPSLIPPQDWSGTSELYTPFQSVGARGVNNLSSKLLLTLFPPNTPFFRYRIDEFSVEKMEQNENLKTKIETGLGKMERSIVNEIETTADRVPAFEGLKHLIVGGNILAYIPPQGSMKIFHLSKYVCKRDPSGNVLEIITKEMIAPSALPENIRSLVETIETVEYKRAEKKGEQGAVRSSDEKACPLYTYVRRLEGNWRVHQEIKGRTIPGSYGTYPLDKSPWMALRFSVIDGEDYGRGYVEEYLGDLRSLEGLAQAIVEGSAAAAKVLFLVNPNGTTKIKDVADAPNGAVRSGNAVDITTLQMQKYNDFNIAAQTSQKIEQRLAMAFLLNSAIQREGERVTAEEIRVMAKDLEDALGGIYSLLSQEFQLPYVNRRQFQMQREGRLPRLPRGMVRPAIVTGLEALGRGNDLQKLDSFLAGAAQVLGPEVIARFLNVSEYLERRATALGIETKGLIKSADEMAAEAQKAQQMQMMQQFGPDALKIGGDMIKERMKQGADMSQMTPQQAMQGVQEQVQGARAAQSQAAQQ